MDILDLQGATLGGGGGGGAVPAFDEEILEDILNWTKDEIVANVLTDLQISSSDVEIRKWPWDKAKVYSGITVHPVDENSAPGWCSEDNVGYGVGITYIHHTDKGIRDVARMSRFRARVRSRFSARKPSLNSVYTCTVEAGAFAMPKMYRNNWDCTSIVVRFWSEEERDRT